MNATASTFFATFFVVLTSAFLVAPSPCFADGGASGEQPRDPDEKPTFWLVDENGSWRAPLPNWSIDDVMRVIDSRDEERNASPWAIQNIDATGRVEEGIARLTIEIEMSVADGVVRAPLGLGEGVYIPESGDSSADESRGTGFWYEGPGLCALDVDRRTGEYAAIFQTPFPKAPTSAADSASGRTVGQSSASGSDSGESSETLSDDAERRSSFEQGRLRPNIYRLALELCFPIETAGQTEVAPRASKMTSDEQERRFVATFPPSLHSQLTLEIPMADAEVAFVSGAMADAPTTMSENASELKLRGLGRGGERVEIGWRKNIRLGEDSDGEERVVYQVEDALIVAELDARGTTYDATLPIRAYGGETDLFRVELPPNAALTPESVAAIGANGASYEIASARVVDENEAQTDSDSGEASGSRGREVEIRLAQKTSIATLSLKARALATDAASRLDARRAPRHISGFNVRDAQKQYGRVRVVKSRDSDFNVTPVYGVSVALDDAFEDGSEVYSFFSQPFLMTAEGYARETIVDARPEYFMTVECDELRLRARFLYSVYGAKIRELRLRLNGWRLSKVSDANNALNQEGIIPANDAGETVIPLSAPSDGEILLELEFVRDVDSKPIVDDAALRAEDKSSCSVSFPAPVSAREESATVVILPANDAALEPRDDLIFGMTRKTARTFPLNFEIPADARQTPLYYQTRLTGADGRDPLFVADIRRLKQEIWVEVKTEAALSETGQFRVNETLEYRIEHEPVDALEFQTLSRLLDSTRDRAVKCFVDGRPQSLVYDPPTAETKSADAASEKSGSTSIPPKSMYAYCRVLLDAPRIGTCVVSLQYELEPLEFRDGLTNQARVELFQPKIDESALNSVSNELTLSAPVGLGLSFSKPSRSARRNEASDEFDSGFQSFWNAEARKFSDDGKYESIRCTSLVAEFSARFSVSYDSRENGATIVDRAWAQSWFAENARVDRVAWRMRDDGRDFVEVRLPERCSPDLVSVAIDGESLPVGGDAKRGLLFREHSVRIPLERQNRSGEFVVELSYVVPNASDSRGRLVVEFPNFAVDSMWIRRIYWQTIFSRKRLVVVDPRDWTPEFVVRRGAGLGALLFRRVPTMTQDDLCDWIGLSRREPIPQEANVYLYSRFCETPARPELTGNDSSVHEERTIPDARLATASNAFIVFLGSGFVLAVGLALVYLQTMTARQALLARWILLGLCAAALIFASLRPLVALLFLQTTAIGVLLTLGVAALNAVLGRGESEKKRGETKNSSEKVA